MSSVLPSSNECPPNIQPNENIGTSFNNKPRLLQVMQAPFAKGGRRDLIFIPKHRVVAACCWYAVQIWNMGNTFTLERTIQERAGCLIAFPDGRFASGGSAVKIWNPARNYQCVKTINIGKRCCAWDLALIDQRYIAVATRSCVQIRENSQKYSCVKKINYPKMSPIHLAVTKMGKLSVMTSSKFVFTYDPKANYKLIGRIAANYGSCCGNICTLSSFCWLRDELVAMSAWGNRISIGDTTKSGKPIQTIQPGGKSSWTLAMTRLHDDVFITGMRNGVLRMWRSNGSVFKVNYRWKGHQDRVYGILFIPESSIMLSTSSDHKIKVWGWGSALKKS